MKRITLLFIVAFTSLSSTFGQKDTASVYTGLVGFCGVSTENPKNISNFANFRVGAQFQKTVSKKTSLNTWITYDPGSNFILFEATSKTVFGKDIYVRYGYGPTPATLIRPFPPTVDGQFQFTAEGIPPGGALGGFVGYKDTKLGIYTRNGNAEIHLGQNVGSFQGDVWYSKNFSGATAQLATKRLYLMATVTDGGRQALAISVQISKKSPLKVVHDFGLQKGEVTNNLLGILYPMKIKTFTDTRFGFAYDFKQKTAGVFWLIGINR